MNKKLPKLLLVLACASIGIGSLAGMDKKRPSDDDLQETVKQPRIDDNSSEDELIDEDDHVSASKIICAFEDEYIDEGDVDGLITDGKCEEVLKQYRHLLERNGGCEHNEYNCYLVGLCALERAKEYDTKLLLDFVRDNGSLFLRAVIDKDYATLEKLFQSGSGYAHEEDEILFPILLADIQMLQIMLPGNEYALKTELYQKTLYSCVLEYVESLEIIEKFVALLVKHGYVITLGDLVEAATNEYKEVGSVFDFDIQINFNLVTCLLSHISDINEPVYKCLVNKLIANQSAPCFFELILHKGIVLHDIEALVLSAYKNYLIQQDDFSSSPFHGKTIISLLFHYGKVPQQVQQSLAVKCAMYNAVVENDWDKLEELLLRGFEPNFSVDGQPLLEIAAKKGRNTSMLFLCAYGAEIQDLFLKIFILDDRVQMCIDNIAYAQGAIVTDDAKPQQKFIEALEDDYKNGQHTFVKMVLQNPRLTQKMLAYAPYQFIKPSIPKRILGRDVNQKPVIKVVSDEQWLEHELKHNAQLVYAPEPVCHNKDAQKLYTWFVMGKHLTNMCYEQQTTDVVMSFK